MPAATHHPLDPADLPEYTEHANHALRIDPTDGFEDYLLSVGAERFRIAREGSRMVAGAGSIASAHHVGGVAVPAALVTAVWAAPHVRGRGVASGLLAALLEDERTAGTPLASLFPANLAVYRRVGFEIAARWIRHRMPLTGLPGRAPAGWTVEPLDDATPEDPGPLADLYDASAPRLGAVATRRVAPLWHAILRWNQGGVTTAALAVDPAGEPRGCVVLDTHRNQETVNVRELQALEPDAARTLLAHLAGFRSIFKDVVWRGSPADPFAALLRDEPRVDTAPAMFRLLDVPAALAARGYPVGLESEIAFDVADETLRGNAGPVVLTLDGTGTGHAERGGAGTVRVTVRALAALYTGHAGPRDLAIAGGLEAPEAELDRLAPAFAGPLPWIADRF